MKSLKSLEMARIHAHPTRIPRDISVFPRHPYAILTISVRYPRDIRVTSAYIPNQILTPPSLWRGSRWPVVGVYEVRVASTIAARVCNKGVCF